MRTDRFTTSIIAATAIALASAVTAEAQNTRSFIATTGNDVNNCTVSAPCRTLTRALSVTNPRGEVVVVDSGGYGPATITQPVTITAIGVDGAIDVYGPGNALNINTSGDVTINGLNLRGYGVGNDGILVTQVGFLRLYNMEIQSFTNDGVDFEASGNLAVYDSKINDCGHDGLLVQGAGARAYVHGSEFDNNAFAGADSAAGWLTIANSSAHYNNRGFFADGGKVELFEDRAIFNSIGIAASGTGAGNGAGTLYFADCLIADNATAYDVGTGGTMAGSSPGTTLIPPGQATVGTLSAAQTLF
jgi:hypothetical protein